MSLFSALLGPYEQRLRSEGLRDLFWRLACDELCHDAQSPSPLHFEEVGAGEAHVGEAAKVNAREHSAVFVGGDRFALIGRTIVGELAGRVRLKGTNRDQPFLSSWHSDALANSLPRYGGPFLILGLDDTSDTLSLGAGGGGLGDSVRRSRRTTGGYGLRVEFYHPGLPNRRRRCSNMVLGRELDEFGHCLTDVYHAASFSHSIDLDLCSYQVSGLLGTIYVWIAV